MLCTAIGAVFGLSMLLMAGLFAIRAVMSRTRSEMGPERNRPMSFQDQHEGSDGTGTSMSLFSGAPIYGSIRNHGRTLRIRDGTAVDLRETGRVGAEGGLIELTPRVTGDLAVTPDGSELGIPGLYVDNTTSVDDPEEPGAPVSDGYGSNGLGVSRLNSALITVPLGPDGRPSPEGSEAVFLPAEVLHDDEFSVIRSYPSSATAALNGKEFLVTMEASSSVVAVRTEGRRGSSDKGHDEA